MNTINNLSMTPETLAALSRQYLACLSRGDWALGLAVAEQALQTLPGHAQILGDVALCQMRLGRLDAAQASYAAALQQAPEEANFLDGLAELHGLRGDAAQCRSYGVRALALKDAACRGPVLWQVPAHRPPGLSSVRQRNVIAYSLFGDNPRYCETALLNVQAAQKLFAEWTVRMYCDATVPMAVRERLAQAGAQLVLCEGDAWQGIPPLMWRFAVMDDPHVDRWLLRDADSLLSTREQAAVQAWLAGGQWFHMMRDYYTHTELLLAGLLGGCGGVLAGLPQQMRAFAAAHTHEQRVVDQHFLRHKVWPTVRQSLLTHDSGFGFMDAQPFPAHAEHGLGEHFHVGCNVASASIGSDNSALPDGAALPWQLLDEQGQVVCAYTTTVQGGAWRCRCLMWSNCGQGGGGWWLECRKSCSGAGCVQGRCA